MVYCCDAEEVDSPWRLGMFLMVIAADRTEQQGRAASDGRPIPSLRSPGVRLQELSRQHRTEATRRIQNPMMVSAKRSG